MKSDEKIEKFTRHIFDEIGLEKPSPSFVKNVMGEIEVLANTKRIVYKPLISKNAWVVILASCIALFLWTAISPIESVIFQDIKINVDINIFKNLVLSDTVIYGISVLGILCIVQVLFLKNRFDKQIEAL